MTTQPATWSTRPAGTELVALTIKQGQAENVVWLGTLPDVAILIQAFESVGCVPAYAAEEGERT